MKSSDSSDFVKQKSLYSTLIKLAYRKREELGDGDQYVLKIFLAPVICDHKKTIWGNVVKQ